MNIIFYSTHCPKCKVLKQKLDMKHVPYTENNSIEDMLAHGLQTAPALSVDGKLMDFAPAIRWVNTLEG